MKQLPTAIKLDINHQANLRNNNYPFYEAAQLRRAKMHAAHLIEALDSNKLLTPSLHQLLEASLILETTDTRILAAYLKRPPASIRSEFQKICATLGIYEGLSKDFQKRPASMNKKSA